MGSKQARLTAIDGRSDKLTVEMSFTKQEAGAQNTPSADAEYRIHWNSLAHFG